MKINTAAGGARILVTGRRGKGVAITQGSSHILLGPDEVGPLIDAILATLAGEGEDGDTRPRLR